MKEEVHKTVQVLRKGGVIIYPTDTIWGLGCDATNEDAVARIFDLKQRKDGKSLIVLMCDDQMMNKYIKQIPSMVWEIIDYSEQPITIIYPEGNLLASQIGGDDGSVAVRIPKDEFCIQVLRKFRKPIVSTSANISSHPHPTRFAEIEPSLLSSVDHVVNLRQQEKSTLKPSSIIKLEMDGEVEIIRK